MPWRIKKPCMDDTRRKILLIEDDKIDQRAFEWLIKEENLPYDCTVARSILEARSALSYERFDIIVTDYLFADGTAFDIFDLIKDTPIIVTTGAGDEETAVKAIKAGACDYLIKDPARNYLKAIPTIVENAIKHKKLEEILEQKQKNLEAIFDAVPVGMLLIDQNLIVKRINDTIRQTVRRDFSQIINRPIGNALCCVNSTYDEKGCGYSPACQSCLLRQALERALSSGQSVQKIEIQPTFKVANEGSRQAGSQEGSRQAGSQITPWLSISAEPVVIDGRKHVVIAIDDITDRKKAEEKLKETMEIKSQFISTVSHELRTPLGCMKEGIAIVLDGLVGQINDQQRKFLDIAKRNVDRLAVLVNNVLDFQELSADKVRLDIQAHDISEVVEEAYQTMAVAAKNKGIDFSLELEDSLPKARFDSAKIIQVLTNLINNAIKFTPQGGKVCLYAGTQGQDMVIRVSDTGMGIPEEALPKIFDRFYRVHRPGKEIQGTGLGLSIVNKIVTMHGGRIEVESEVDKGTTFIVFLPLAGPPSRLPEILPEKIDETLEKTLAN